MGGIIEARKLTSRRELFRLLIYVKPDYVPANAFSVNKPLAEKLLSIKPSRRSMQLEKCFNEVVSDFPPGAVIKDIDVMFNPDYKVDVMRILIAANKLKPISVIWPGRCAEGKLYYSEESLPDYKVFEISDYDIYCVV